MVQGEESVEEERFDRVVTPSSPPWHREGPDPWLLPHQHPRKLDSIPLVADFAREAASETDLHRVDSKLIHFQLSG